MLFDLQVVGQINAYQKFDSIEPLNICNRNIRVSVRIFDYI